MADYDTIVIGGGPAGCSAAAVLAEKGRRTLVLEKEKFPRYRVGESLLPYCYFPLERIGMIEKLRESSFVKKYSVQFAAKDGRISQPFYFFKHLKHNASQTWQVERDRFDQMLMDNAREKGAEVLEETAAKQLIMTRGCVVGVEAQGPDGQTNAYHAPITIDCSGRDGFAINRNDWRVRDPNLSKVAIWTYFRGGLRDPGLDEGATTVAYLPEKGWFWYIPLLEDTVSVGVTAERDYLYRNGKDLDAIFRHEMKKNQWISQHLAKAEQVQRYWVTGDYSYRSRYCAADGLVLAGDALAFLDPVFSSGVFLALYSGVLAGDVIDEALSARDVSAERFARYGEQICYGIESMRKLVYAFYDKAFSFGKLLRKNPGLRGDLTDCLIGNLFRDFDPLFDAIGEFAEMPVSLPHGRPLVAAGDQ